MALFDKPLEELRTYTPAREEQGDFNVFWSDTLAAARSYDLNAQFVPVESGLRMLDVFDVTYNGYGGQPVKGWLILPAVREQPLPVVVEYIGYGGGRGLPIDWLLYASAGYAHFVMDTRGQGSAWSKGDTPDLESDGGNPQFPGFMTRGVLDPKTYYYRRVFADAVRAVEAAMGHEWVDEMRVAVTGGSQGGGIALAVAGLSPLVLDDAVKVAMPDVPFLCHYRRATEIVDTHPYQEIVRFCKVQRDQIDTVFRTLSYFDGVNFAARATAQSLFSVAMMDDICPPSTVFAAYNHYQGPKDIRVWAFNNHEGGQAFQNVAKLQFLHDRWE